MAFDITSVLKANDSGKDQIVYLDLDLLDPDPENFYSLDGLDDLAGNIELIGLQQPLRVRPGENGHYIIISGHRRRAACMMIRDGGSDQFKDGVPCIVEYGEASAAMRELRLIYANAATRMMSAADLSKQAERVETLLYELKEQGVEFPGRMRDHVAEACKVSKSKLARLHAIRSNLDSGLLKYFDKGELPEETAYQLQKMPKRAQELIGKYCDKREGAKWFYSWQVEKALDHADEYMNPKPSEACGHACSHREERFLQAMRDPYGICEYGCCLKCPRMDICDLPCQKAAEKRKQEKAKKKNDQAAADNERREKQKAEQLRFRSERQKAAQRVLPLIEAKGLGDDYMLPATIYDWNEGPSVSYLRKQAAGDFGDEYYYHSELIPMSISALNKWADLLDCSIDFLVGRADTPKPAKVSGSDTGWQTGTPGETGDYVVRSGIPDEEGPKTSTYRIIHWNGEGWAWIGTGVPFADQVYRWVKLPEV